MHALIVGAPGVGKSTLIRHILTALDRPVFGFESRREVDLSDELNGSPIYIYDIGAEHRRSTENLAGYSKDGHLKVFGEAFDRYAEKLCAPVPVGHVVVMDELGIMESSSETFCRAALSLLDGRTPVIAAVKTKNTAFLDAVRNHPNGKCFYISHDNRDELRAQILDFMRKQISGAESEP